MLLSRLRADFHSGKEASMSSEASANPHPVTYFVTPQLDGRNRLTCFFRWLLIIPQALLVGGVPVVGLSVIGVIVQRFVVDGSSNYFGFGGSGVLGLLASVVAFITWFAIVFTGKQPRGLWDLVAMYLRWKSKVMAYGALLRDEYPPFGDGDYPVQFGLGEFPEERNRVTVGFRIFLIIPHAIILSFLSIAWAITAFIGWLAIMFTGSYPEGLYHFAVGYLRWSIRVEAYFLLIHDEYPPFSLD
jgi:Domain of unknown function (DUF4389)